MRDTCVFSVCKPKSSLAVRPTLDPPFYLQPCSCPLCPAAPSGPGACMPLCPHTPFPPPVTPFPAPSLLRSIYASLGLRDPSLPPLDPQQNLPLPPLHHPAQESFNRVQSHTSMYYPPSAESQFLKDRNSHLRVAGTQSSTQRPATAQCRKLVTGIPKELLPGV